MGFYVAGRRAGYAGERVNTLSISKNSFHHIFQAKWPLRQFCIMDSLSWPRSWLEGHVSTFRKSFSGVLVTPTNCEEALTTAGI